MMVLAPNPRFEEVKGLKAVQKKAYGTDPRLNLLFRRVAGARADPVRLPGRPISFRLPP